MQTIQTLSYDGIRNAFVDYLKSSTDFKDYNFQASGISSLVNILSYNTHYIGYYIKMLLNESFVDSAHLRESMASHAKLVGYVPRSVKAAEAELYVTVSLPTEPEDLKVTVLRGTKFTATTGSGIRKVFVTVDDFTLYEHNGSPPNIIYKNTTDPLTPIVVKEGEFKIWNFDVDGSIDNQRYVLKQKNVDYDTIRVRIFETDIATVFENYNLATFDNVISGETRVFYITTNENGYYEIFFGNDVFGKSVSDGNRIEVSYIVTSGNDGNGAGTLGTWSIEGLANGRPITIDSSYPKPIAFGGLNEESIESQRFTIPNHYRRQNRIVTKEDYRTLILGQYRNIESINVWGGEESYRKEFGKVFLSIKPKYADKLSDTAKNDINTNIIDRYGVIGIDVIFVDPEYIKLNLDIYATYDKKKTDLAKGEIESIIITSVQTYNTDKLNVFESSFSEVDLLDYVRSQENSIKSLYSINTMSKDIKVLYVNNPENEVIFGNAIQSGITTNTFLINGVVCSIIDIDSKLYVVKDLDKTKMIAQNIGSIDYKSGVLVFKLPNVIVMTGDSDRGNYGILTITVKSIAPDVNTYMNNIIRIAKIKVQING
jgi:hypothetical protein